MQIIAIASGKGKMGCTMLTANLAVALVQNDKRVLVVDLSPSNYDLHTTLGLTDYRQGLATYVENLAVNLSAKLEHITYQTCYENLFLIPAGPGNYDMANIAPEIKQYLLYDLKSQDYDYMLLDLGAQNSSYNMMDFFLLSGCGIVVIEPAAILNAYLFLKNSVFRIMASSFGENSTVYHYLKELKKDGISLEKIYLTKLLEQAREIDYPSYQELEAKMKLFQPQIVLNILRQPSDMQRADKFCHSCHQYLSVNLKHLGVIYYDEVQMQARKSQLPVVAYQPQAIISQAIYCLADKIIAIEHSHNPSPLYDVADANSVETEEMFALDSPKDFIRDSSDAPDSPMSNGNIIPPVNIRNGRGLLEKIQYQQLNIQQLRLENQYLKKKLLDNMAKQKEALWSKSG